MIPVLAVDAAGRVRWCARCKAIYRSDFARCPVDGAALQIGMSDPLIGTTVGQHYVIDAFLGEGAMARVYRAHHARLTNKQFAVKVMIGDYAAILEMRMRFTQEAEAASKLDHPNVVSVIDFGKTDSGAMFLAMELVEGRTLTDVIADEGTIAPGRALALTRQICLGLGHAHDRGLIHRDLKPDNIMITGDSALPRIVDFGLAIPVDDEHATRLTDVGFAMGTPIYAAPEQTHSGSVDHRADLFALGVTLYEMLAGKPPFDGTVAELVRQNASDRIPTIEERSGVEVPRAVEAIVRRLLRRDPKARYANAAEVIAAIDELGLASAGPVSLVSHAAAPRARRGAGFAAIAVLGVAALGVGGYVGVRRLSATTAPAIAHAPAPPALRVAAQPRAAPAPVVATEPQAPDPAPEPAHPAPLASAASTTARRPGAPHATPAHHPTHDSHPAHAVARPVVAAAEPDATPLPEPPHPVVTPPTPTPTPPPRPLWTTAQVRLAGLRIRGALADDEVKNAVDRVMPALRTCYRTSARAALASPAVTVRMSLAIDESRRATNVHAEAAGMPALAACAATALDQLRVMTSPDTGGVTVTLDLAFVPVSP